MSIYIDEQTRVLVQGITGRQGSFHTGQMLAYGTKITGGVSPGKGGSAVEGVPVYNTVFEAMEAEPAEASIVFIPAPYARDAAFEAIAAGLKLLVLIPEHIPLHDAMEIMAYARQEDAIVVGPNNFGLISSGRSKIGIMPNHYFKPGPVGVVTRSGTLCYEIVSHLLAQGLGTSSVVGLGGDRIGGLHFIDALEAFAADPETEAIIMIGEIGGSAEEEAAAYIATGLNKPVVAYLAGRSAPPGKRMGHAGAIIQRDRGSYDGKRAALEAAGVTVAELPGQVPGLVKASMKRA